MFTCVSYDQARVGAQAALLALTASVDDHVSVAGNDVTVPELSNLVGAYFAHGTRAVAGSFLLGQIKSPSMLLSVLKDITRGHDTNTIIDSEQLDLWLDDPIALRKDELLEAWMANGALAAARGLAVLMLSDGPMVPVKGDIRTVRFTSVVAPTADVWSLGVLTPQQQLPAGKYQVVGMCAVVAAECGWARLVLTGYSWRPGCPYRTAIQNPDITEFRYGRMGVWGEFQHNTIPRLQVLTLSAVANPDIYLDLIKVG